MRRHTLTIPWTLQRINDLGVEVDVEYEIEYTISDYDPGRTSGPPEKCYPPEGGEVEILEIVLCNDGHGKRVTLDPKNWSAAGFNDTALEQIDDAAFEHAMDCLNDDADPPEPMDMD